MPNLREEEPELMTRMDSVGMGMRFTLRGWWRGGFVAGEERAVAHSAMPTLGAKNRAEDGSPGSWGNLQNNLTRLASNEHNGLRAHEAPSATSLDGLLSAQERDR